MVEEKNYKQKKEEHVVLVRVLGKDIRGDIKINSALTKINGISWGLSNAVCKILGLDRTRYIQDFSKDELKTIEDFMKDPKVPAFLKNRRNDLETGNDLHISGVDLKLVKEFDLKRMKKIKSYKGIRHTVGLPVRGQRTKGNFRRNRKPSVAAAKKKEKK
ncbi:MAG TPA: 30S ribosomal protein S13 [Candidatus Pacearchaeota archaeon]|nr:30S ribosomal protein S13 [Candidatus Pacearchaeota archaeon]